MRLYHFSEEAGIARFTPRGVRTPSPRAAGFDWLNGPLVWAIDEPRQPLYLFPRECPRVLVWRLPTTTQADQERWWGDRSCPMIAHIEWAWLERFRTTRLFRYELPAQTFEDVQAAGMGWVSREPVEPIAVEVIEDLPAALAATGVELRLMKSLLPLKGVWDTSLHASGIRLRNAAGWES